MIELSIFDSLRVIIKTELVIVEKMKNEKKLNYLISTSNLIFGIDNSCKCIITNSFHCSLSFANLYLKCHKNIYWQYIVIYI